MMAKAKGPDIGQPGRVVRHVDDEIPSRIIITGINDNKNNDNNMNGLCYSERVEWMRFVVRVLRGRPFCRQVKYVCFFRCALSIS